MSKQKPELRSDRDKYGLKGPVISCAEEVFDGTGSATRWSSVEFDAGGRLVLRRSRNLDGSISFVRQAYGPSGLLTTISAGQEGQPSHDVVHIYDEQGRIEKTVDSTGFISATYTYDSHGAKTKTQVSRSEDYIPTQSAGGSPFSVADRRPNLPGGGTARTIYDDNDRPLEVEVRDVHGELISRATRHYDNQGRIVREDFVAKDLAVRFPSVLEGRDLIPSRTELADVMFGKGRTYSEAYTYDASDRVTRIIRQSFDQEVIIVKNYNDQGEEASENWETREPGVEPVRSQIRYTYRYDANGNWIEKNELRPDERHGKADVTIRRSISYL
jgi:hypothetical protein